MSVVLSIVSLSDLYGGAFITIFFSALRAEGHV